MERATNLMMLPVPCRSANYLVFCKLLKNYTSNSSRGPVMKELLITAGLSLQDSGTVMLGTVTTRMAPSKNRTSQPEAFTAQMECVC